MTKHETTARTLPRNAGKSWSASEDRRLLAALRGGNTIKRAAEWLGRDPAECESHLARDIAKQGAEHGRKAAAEITPGRKQDGTA